MTERGVPVVFRPENRRREAAPRGSGLTVYVPGKSLFHEMRNRVGSGTDGIRGAVQQLRRRLPPTWKVTQAARVREATIVIRAPDSRVAQLVVVSRRSMEPRDVAGILPTGRVQRSRANAVLVTAPFLSPRTRELLVAAGVSYIDSTGNLRLALERPSIFVEAQGAQQDPAREPRPLVSLKGPAAGRVVRALCDFRPPYGVRALAERCATTPASVSRVVSLLERDAIVVRGESGEIAEVDWPALLRRWTQDYKFASSNTTMPLFDPRGLDVFVEKLRSFDRPYAITGSLAAARKVPVAVSHLAMVYTDDSAAAAEALELGAVERAANVVLTAPFDPVVFDRSWSEGGVTYAALSQVAADLLTSPGRGPAEGTEIIAWMQKNERAWRS